MQDLIHGLMIWAVTLTGYEQPEAFTAMLSDFLDATLKGVAA